jgi:hypothetical protein
VHTEKRACIVFLGMWRCLIVVLLLLTLPAIPVWAIDGTFQGRVVDPPLNQPNLRGWIYVEGRNHMLRRVEVSHADIILAVDIRSKQKRRCSLECLSPGQEIRVTAEQDPRGEWRAKRVEILRLPATSSI